MLMTTQYCDCTKCHRILCFAIVKMVNFMLRTSTSIKKKSEKDKKKQPTSFYRGGSCGSDVRGKPGSWG